ncbi:MAG: hypothetical protein AB1714_15870 [Acidobacteriota bacterium]
MAQISGKALVDFWPWAVEKGLIKKPTASSYLSAVRRVTAGVDGFEQQDVSAMDVEHVLTRFHNRSSQGISPKTLGVYSQRFRQAVGIYLDYAKSPAGWRFRGKPGARRGVPRGRTGSAQYPVPESERAGEIDPVEPVSSNTIEYPFPLRPDCTARLKLPRDLRKAEVERLKTFLDSLPMDLVQDKP